MCYVNKVPKFTKSITSDVHHMNLFRKDQFSLLGYFIYQSTIRPPAPKRFDSHVTGFFHGIYYQKICQKICHKICHKNLSKNLLKNLSKSLSKKSFKMYVQNSFKNLSKHFCHKCGEHFIQI